MAFCIMCCTCRRLMDRNGGLTESTLEEIAAASGYVMVTPVFVDTHPIPGHVMVPNGTRPESLADYATKELADAACLRYGWTTRTPSGTPDHTCPGCQLKATMAERESKSSQPRKHGAYIDSATLRITE